MPRLDQFHHPGRFVGPYGEIVADRQDSQVNAFLCYYTWRGLIKRTARS